ncbi:hypothetical protein [Paludisphaera soli]|uniref:hypothetical protein n=1 Tax=Paludisphaera soli TaxID=2712865 RepID=UPI0013ED4454|nr:hypothetical protein [Paludisphaera soli]
MSQSPPASLHDPDFDEPGTAAVKAVKAEGLAHAGRPDDASGAGIWGHSRLLLARLAPAPLAPLVLRPPSGGLIADLARVYATILLVGLSQLLAWLRLVELGLRGPAGLGNASAVCDAKAGPGESAGASDPLVFRRVGDVVRVRTREGVGRIAVVREKAGGIRIQIAPPPRASAGELSVGDLGLLALTGCLGFLAIVLVRTVREQFRITEVVVLRGGWIGIRRPGSERGHESHPLSEVRDLGCGRSTPLLWALIAGEVGSVGGQGGLLRSIRGWNPFRRPTIRFGCRGETVRFGDALSRDEARYVVSLLRAGMEGAGQPGQAPGDAAMKSWDAKGAGDWPAIPWQVRAIVYLGLWTGVGGGLLAIAELRRLSRPDAAEDLAVILGEGTARGAIPLVWGDWGHIRYRIGGGDGPGGGYSSGGTISVTPGGMSFVEIGGIGELRGRIDDLRALGNGLVFRGERARWALRLLNLWALTRAAATIAACVATVRRHPRARPALTALACLGLAEGLAWIGLTSVREPVLALSLIAPTLVLVALGRPDVRSYFLRGGGSSPGEADRVWAEAARDLA